MAKFVNDDRPLVALGHVTLEVSGIVESSELLSALESGKLPGRRNSPSSNSGEGAIFSWSGPRRPSRPERRFPLT